MNLTEYNIDRAIRIVTVKTLRTYNHLGRVNSLGIFKISYRDYEVVEPSTEDNFDAFLSGEIFLNDEFGNEIVIDYDEDSSSLSDDEARIHNFITRTVKNVFGQDTQLDLSEWASYETVL